MFEFKNNLTKFGPISLVFISAGIGFHANAGQPKPLGELLSTGSTIVGEGVTKIEIIDNLHPYFSGDSLAVNSNSKALVTLKGNSGQISFGPETTAVIRQSADDKYAISVDGNSVNVLVTENIPFVLAVDCYQVEPLKDNLHRVGSKPGWVGISYTDGQVSGVAGSVVVTAESGTEWKVSSNQFLDHTCDSEDSVGTVVDSANAPIKSEKGLMGWVVGAVAGVGGVAAAGGSDSGSIGATGSSVDSLSTDATNSDGFSGSSASNATTSSSTSVAPTTTAAVNPSVKPRVTSSSSSGGNSSSGSSSGTTTSGGGKGSSSSGSTTPTGGGKGGGGPVAGVPKPPVNPKASPTKGGSSSGGKSGSSGSGSSGGSGGSSSGGNKP